MKKRHVQKLVLTSGFLFLGLNLPLVLLYDKPEPVFGLPAAVAGIFLIWLASVVISFAIFKKYDD